MRHIVAISLALLLSACGGGSDSSSTSQTPLAVEAPGTSATELAPNPVAPTISLSSTAPYDDLNSDSASITTPSSTPSTFCGNTAGGLRITGTVSSVHDGDTITVAGNSIRLDSIDAPELKQAYGIESRDKLANLVNGQSVTVTYAKKDKYGRIVGTVFKNDCTQVNLRQVETGSAWYYEAYKCEISAGMRNSYDNAQALARSEGRGLWAFAAISPWVYRNGVEAKVPPSCKNGDLPFWETATASPVEQKPAAVVHPIDTKPSGITPPASTATATTPPSSSSCQIWVNPYTRKDGTRVKGYYRSNPKC